MTDLTNTRLGTEEVVILTILRIQDVGLLGHYHYHLSADTILDILVYVLCSLASSSYKSVLYNKSSLLFCTFCTVVQLTGQRTAEQFVMYSREQDKLETVLILYTIARVQASRARAETTQSCCS